MKLKHHQEKFASFSYELKKEIDKKGGEHKADLSERSNWNAAICVDKTENWLLKVTICIYPTSRQINHDLKNEKLVCKARER